MTIVEKFQSWSLPWRVAVSLGVSFIAGPGLIGFLSEYATYWYALGERVRPPVEGIPYLAATVTVASMLIAAVVSAVFLISRGVVGYLVGGMIMSVEEYAKAPLQVFSRLKLLIKDSGNAESLEKSFVQIGDAPNAFKTLKPKRAWFVALSAGAAAFTFSLWLISKQNDPNALSQAWLIGSYVSLLLLSLWRRFFMLLVSVIAALAFYFFSISLLFNPHYYSGFLRVIGFGGGVLVQVDISGEDQPTDMFLVLRSKEWLIGRKTRTQENIEIPVQNVERITYVGNGDAER